jgi:transcriptional regulator GlxA family with amidase domain
LFKTHVGRSPHAYLLLWRMRRAARELRATDRPVKAIALEAGYPEQAQFSQVFRRVIGVPPSEFRRAMPPL